MIFILDGETITLRRFKQSLGGGVICARFNSNRDEVSLDLTFPLEKQYALFVDSNDHPSARIHLTGYQFFPNLLYLIILTIESIFLF